MTVKHLKGGAKLDGDTHVMEHSQLINKDGAVQCDILIAMFSIASGNDHEPLLKRELDDAMLSIGEGAAGNEEFGHHDKGILKATAQAHANVDAKNAEQQAGAGDKQATSTSVAAAAKETPKANETENPAVHVLPTPQHETGDPSGAPETVKAPKPAAAKPVTEDKAVDKTADKAKKPHSKSAHYVAGSGEDLREGLYGKDGIINKDKLSHHSQVEIKGKKIDIDLTEVEYDFKERVYKACTDRLGKARLFGGVPDEELTTLDGGRRIRHAVVGPLKSMLDACKAAMPAKGYDIKVGSAYRDPVEDFGLWNDGFNTNYLWNTKKEREAKWPKDPYGKEAVDYMVGWIGQSKAAPGGSNHSNGIAVDLQVQVDGEWVHATFKHQEAWYASKQFAWLQKNCRSYGFKRYEAEAWHYDYKP